MSLPINSSTLRHPSRTRERLVVGNPYRVDWQAAKIVKEKVCCVSCPFAYYLCVY